ncbi:sodium-dependent multivitamin transporter-like isoform X2 [Pomacea canaliculata]|nr:sodium-dependent multivitamin transporter-like isoform X2 [Pomacea canaliculata]XP_025093641.1 sodium-dependent multivitamin transporter-like isoform X2 [Pomacea canaliculata]XP_025093648.1 sodium-dependent multivitamin transporter-like isoform X2 [Pomacea canaliculata]XP_025093658.1 sodium-dependent multivitamin transporter-like isoform X2 [Pomacea canaliculata]XP_025093668.1 sodium-dependent multivitamin transporter-like isoform X2 [Pomacea canaliculata]XP_025093677.1 sodium-dependent mul
MQHSDSSITTGVIQKLGFLDYIIFATLLLTSMVIGGYQAYRDRENESVVNFLMAERNMHPLPVALSLLSSYVSAVSMLGVPAEVYLYSTLYIWIGVSYPLVMLATAYIYLPIFHALRITSVYAYLEKRFSKMIRAVAVITFVMQMISYMALVLYAPSLAIHSVTGFSLWSAVWIVGIVCTSYTALGGIKAVMWTDVFQSAVMFAGLLTVAIKGMMAVGGIATAWDDLYTSGRVVFAEFSPDPSVRHTVWSLFIGGFFSVLGIYGVNQVQVQRLCTSRTLCGAQIALMLNVPLLWFFLLAGLVTGVAIYSFYSTCDPLSVGIINSTDQVLPLFVMDAMGKEPGIPGLFVASIFSGALGTISSGLNSVSAVLLEDIIRSHLDETIGETQIKNLLQLIILMISLLCLAVVHIVAETKNILQAALSLYGLFAGPILGLFSLGLFFPWANESGALAGLLASLTVMAGIVLGSIITVPSSKFPYSPRNTHGCPNITEFMKFISNNTSTATPTPADAERWFFYPLFTISYIWYGMYSVIIVIVVGLLVSFVTGPTKPSEINPWLICPIFDILPPFKFLPEPTRKLLRWGVRPREINNLEEVQECDISVEKFSSDDEYNDDEMSMTRERKRSSKPNSVHPSYGDIGN